MSLLVHAYTRSGSKPDFVPIEHSEELAGFEVCRRTLWGHPFVASLGLSLLPSLAHTDVCCEGEESLAQLSAEVELLIARCESVSAATSFDTEFILHRCRNILGAIRRARELDGGVIIG